MKLTRLRVEQLRQFRQPFELAGLEPGLNLFSGPNEAGKSTLVRALRAAFFERHRSTSVDDLLPWGEASAAPTIEIDFAVGQQVMKLRKSFLQKKRCELTVGVRTLDGDEAEQHLAELLGFEFSGRGASKPEHWGIPGLLWIEQGAGQDIREPVSNARNHLRKALEQSTGELANGHGDQLIAEVREQRSMLLTGSGRNSKTYTAAIEEESDLRAQLIELDERIGQYRQQVDQLGQLLTEDAAEQLARPWEQFRARQREAEARMAAIDVLKSQSDADRATLAQTSAKIRLIEAQLLDFEAQQKNLAVREATLTEAEARVNALGAASENRAAASAAARAAYEAATEALAVSRQEALRAELRRSVAEATTRIADLGRTLSAAEAEQRQLAAFQKILHETVVQKADISCLREQHARLEELRIRQEAAATRLRFAFLPGVNATIGAAQLSADGEEFVSADTTLHISGVGTIQITPGGQDLALLARENAELQAAHLALLQRIGADSIVDAEARHALHQQAASDVRHAEKSLASLAPHGLESLRAALAGYTANHAEAQVRLAELPPCPAQAPEALASAAARQQTAGTELDAATKQAAEARLALATAQAHRDGAVRERDALLALLQSAERLARQQSINQDLLNSRAERDALEARLQVRQQELEAARPDILAQDIERFKRSADQSERQYRERLVSIKVLQGKLEEAGAHGLEELRGELAIRADAAQRRVRELRLRAQALDLLLGLLESKQQALTRRLQAPLQKHVHRYLQLLFPDATLDIDEELIPGMLTRVNSRGAESGHYNAMSYGAREQMGVISRLAYADLLKDAGRPTLIILDDALVHSDGARLEQMKRVLFDASQRHQVLLFTCHPASWQDLGASSRTIAR